MRQYGVSFDPPCPRLHIIMIPAGSGVFTAEVVHRHFSTDDMRLFIQMVVLQNTIKPMCTIHTER